MSKHWDDLLKRPMTRKEFLRNLGIGALVVLNLEGITKLLTGHGLGFGGHHPVDHGYSSDGYSGFVGKEPPRRSSKGFDS